LLILVDGVASCELPFTAQPTAPAFVSAGASGWAVNNEINSLLIRMVQQTAMDVNVLRQKTGLILTRRLFFSHGQSQTAARVSLVSLRP
jgi:hypothetical protein